jgi:hypothetical protein
MFEVSVLVVAKVRERLAVSKGKKKYIYMHVFNMD